MSTPRDRRARALTVVFDAEASARSKDDNGYLHVKSSHITKAVVNPYYGSEIPGWKERGLDPDELYYGYRDPEELKKSLPTWEGLPLHMEHHVDSADDPQKDTRVGSVGTGVRWNAPYVDAPLTIWDQTAIDAIESGEFKALSCGYRYEPDWTPGVVDGISYDFVMRDISGNHVALVADGRAGPEVVVADSNIPQGGKDMKKMAHDSDPAIEKKEVDLAQAIIDLHKVDPVTGEVKDLTEDEDKAEVLRDVIGQISGKISPTLLAKLAGAVEGLRFNAPQVDDNDPETADENQGEAMPADEESIKSAMDECGLDSDDEDEVKAFKAGMEFANASGADCDTQDEDPEGKDCDTEDEDPDAKDCDTKDCDTEDEDTTEDEDEPKGASDHRARKRGRRIAMDAAAVKKTTISHIRSLYKACETVKPLVGEVDALAFDSAASVYKHALRKCGKNPNAFPRSAWEGMVHMLLDRTPNGSTVAKDAKPMSFDGVFANLKNIVR